MARRPGLTRERVVRAAAELVNAEGLEALSITRLAEKLGVQPPSLYNHVDGLDDLRRELALVGHRRLAACMAEAAIGRSGEEALVAAAEANRQFIKEAPGVYAAGLRASGTLAQADETLREAEEEVLRIVMTILRSFHLEGEEAIHAARGLRSLVHGFTTLEVSGGFGLPVNLDESFRRLLGMLVLGMQR